MTALKTLARRLKNKLKHQSQDFEYCSFFQSPIQSCFSPSTLRLMKKDKVISKHILQFLFLKIRKNFQKKFSVLYQQKRRRATALKTGTRRLKTKLNDQSCSYFKAQFKIVLARLVCGWWRKTKVFRNTFCSSYFYGVIKRFFSFNCAPHQFLNFYCIFTCVYGCFKGVIVGLLRIFNIIICCCCFLLF